MIAGIAGIKLQARFDISENVNIHSGSDNLEDSELVTGLCNTKDNNALEVTVKGNDDEGSPSDEEEEENVSNIELVQVEKASRIKYQGTTLDIILLTAKTIS
ncbi:9598_t:CDS:2 [Rhizophagus irregularis]|nr:9598_t:CDS:2 [Rhizophagus irregularis]